MPTVTPCLSLPYPLPSDPPDVAGDIQRLAQKLDTFLCGHSGKTVGEIFAWLDTGKPYPTGSLLLNGATFNPATYPKLQAHLGTNVLPNLTGRFLMMANATYPAGTAGGYTDAVLIQHSHTGPAHTHTIDHGHTASATGSTSVTGDGAHQHVIDPPFTQMRQLTNRGVNWFPAIQSQGAPSGLVPAAWQANNAVSNAGVGFANLEAGLELGVDIPAFWSNAGYGGHSHGASTSVTVTVNNFAGPSGPATYGANKTGVEGTVPDGAGRNLPLFYSVQFLIQAA